ncbi:MAG TPA: Ig-like domain repeat protein [Acidobacteriaceae bacterium]|jgi:protocatechuate 3,4-dioxygenase beta subunit
MLKNGPQAYTEIDEEHEGHHWCPRLDRRVAMRLISMSALAAAAGCGSGGSASTSTSSGTTATTTSLSASPATASTGTSVTLTATVSPSAASGTVTFYDGSTALGTGTLSSGKATFPASFSTAGTHTLKAAYGGDTSYAASTSATVSLSITAGSSSACSSTAEGEEGPYFVDDSASGYDRSNILSNLDGSSVQAGVPFVLTVYVFDSKNSCSPMQNVQVDIWHCNASGIYSAESVESTVGQSWLRGYQLSDSSGKVQFTTIIPGWYSGRTTHIHMRFRSSYDMTDNSGSNTMQVFFDQTLIDTLSTSVAPYSSEGKNPTTNAGDRVYASQEQGTTLLSLAGSTAAGYAATFNAYMPIS